MQKFKENLVEQVRSGKAQVQVDGNSKWGELLRIIFPKRTDLVVTYNYYHSHIGAIDGYKMLVTPNNNLPIIQAKDFLVQEPEVNWVEVRDNEHNPWRKRIFIADLGPRVVCRYAVVSEDCEKDYISGGQLNSTVHYKYMREIPQPEPLTHSELEKLIGKPFKYVAE